MVLFSARYICAQCRRATAQGKIHPQRPRVRRPDVSRRDHPAVRFLTSQADGGRPFRLGIIGSGPAGFYAAARVLQKEQDAMIDMYEQLPAPFGLVRYGVAPDHPEVKNCQERFAEVAASSRFTFIGNMRIGTDISLGSLKDHYDALLFSYGAAEDKTLNIPGEQLKGVFSARAFVGWYNGLPEYDGLDPDLQNTDAAMVIGNGNVALDVARILLSPLDVLARTDISERALERLSKSRVKNVAVGGRRGPMQASFTIKEVRELMNLPSVGFDLANPELAPDDDFISTLPKLEQRRYRIAKVMRQGSKTPMTTADKRWSLNPMISPVAFEAAGEGPKEDQLRRIIFEKTEFEQLSEKFSPLATVRSTGKQTSMDAGLAFRSIGYKSLPLPGLELLGIPFDRQRGIIPNDLSGRVMSDRPGLTTKAAIHVPGCYCAGWVKRGPTGVIASTMDDAFATADAIIKDWNSEVKFLNGSTRSIQAEDVTGWNGVQQTISDVGYRAVTWQEWLKIDKIEQQTGKSKGKPREKFRSAAAMLAVLD